MRRTMKTLSEDSPSAGRDLNQRPPKQERHPVKKVTSYRIYKQDEMGGNVACRMVARNVYETLAGKRQRKRSLHRHTLTRKLEDNFKTYFTDIGRKCMDWIHLAQGMI
jgi:hypothetical protein